MTPASREAILYAYARGYRVSMKGVLTGPCGRLQPTPTSAGYPSFKVGPHGRQRTILLHVFAAYCWYGKAVFEAECVRHKDDVRTNCTRKNIALGSRTDNSMDRPASMRLRIGRNAVRTRHERTRAKRAARDVRIVKAKLDGMSNSQVAAKFGVGVDTVKRAVAAYRRAHGPRSIPVYDAGMYYNRWSQSWAPRERPFA